MERIIRWKGTHWYVDWEIEDDRPVVTSVYAYGGSDDLYDYFETDKDELDEALADALPEPFNGGGWHG